MNSSTDFGDASKTIQDTVTATTLTITSALTAAGVSSADIKTILKSAEVKNSILTSAEIVVAVAKGDPEALAKAVTITAAGACIFCVAKKGNSDAALSPQSAPFFWLAQNSPRLSNVSTLPKNNALYERDIEKMKLKQRVALEF